MRLVWTKVEFDVQNQQDATCSFQSQTTIEGGHPSSPNRTRRGPTQTCQRRRNGVISAKCFWELMYIHVFSSNLDGAVKVRIAYDITSHHTTQHYIVFISHDMACHHFTLQYISLFVTLHIASHYITSYHTIPHHITPYHTPSHHLQAVIGADGVSFGEHQASCLKYHIFILGQRLQGRMRAG